MQGARLELSMQGGPCKGPGYNCLCGQMSKKRAEGQVRMSTQGPGYNCLCTQGARLELSTQRVTQGARLELFMQKARLELSVHTGDQVRILVHIFLFTWTGTSKN